MEAIEKDLEREASRLGLRLRASFAPGDFPVRPPVLPSFFHRIGGTVRMPEFFLSTLMWDELRCAFLHEAAHVKLRHLPKDLAFASALLLPALALSRGSALLFVPAVFAVGLLALAFHRRFELEADRFAARMVSRRAMIRLLQKLGERCGEGGGLLGISHPSIRERIRNLMAPGEKGGGRA